MKVQINCQVKNEEPILKQVLPLWEKYPVDKFIFCDDSSTDNSIEVIKSVLGERAVILDSNTSQYEEGYNRHIMLEHSRDDNSDIVISIDADELLSNSFVEKFNEVMALSMQKRVFTYQFNVAESLHKIRQDPFYINNFRDFIFPIKYTNSFDKTKNMFSLNQRHATPRTPTINLPAVSLKDYGFVHLQAINIEFYALKQLYYKVSEYLLGGSTPSEINSRYDHVVNNLNFCSIDTPSNIIDNDWTFDVTAYDTLAVQRDYKNYILRHGVDELLTFGKGYLE